MVRPGRKLVRRLERGVDGIGGFAKFSVPRIEVGDEAGDGVVIPQVKARVCALHFGVIPCPIVTCLTPEF